MTSGRRYSSDLPTSFIFDQKVYILTTPILLLEVMKLECVEISVDGVQEAMRQLTELAPEVIEEYQIQALKDNSISIYEPGTSTGYINIPAPDYIRVTRTVVELRAETYSVTFWREVTAFHVTIFPAR